MGDQPLQNDSNASELRSPSGPPTCAICGRTYSRIDHLERHLRSHYQTKPFSCPVCNKAFARVDALKRHQISHDPSVNKRQKVDHLPRPRTGQACRSCAAAKLKCEDEKPCARCRQKGIDCVYSRASTSASHGRNDSISISTPATDRSSVGSRLLNIVDDHNQSGGLAGPPLDSQNSPMLSFQGQAADPPSTMPDSYLRSHNLGQPDHSIASDSVMPEPMTGPFSPDLMIADMFAESSLADFLNEIMLPPVPLANDEPVSSDTANQTRLQRDYLDFGTSWVDMADFEAMLQNNYTEPLPGINNVSFNLPAPPSGAKTPVFGDSFGARNAAFSRSIWRWVPTKKDHGGAAQLDLSLPSINLDSPETRNLAETLLPGQHIEQSLRDRLLALILGTCDQAVHQLVVTAFPSADLLDRLMHFSLGVHFTAIDSWIHVPSLVIEENLELLMVIIAAGAVLSSVTPIRRLGHALQESARTAFATKFESNNQWTRDLASIQGLVLSLHIGLWSGDKRKMEIAESFTLPPITMLRRAGRFSRMKRNFTPPTFDDADEALELKWREWAQAESYKRLAAHLLIQDAQGSMAQQVPPLLCASEMTLELPSSRELWTAGSARQWRNVYVNLDDSLQDKSISIAQGIPQVGDILGCRGLDTSLSAMIIVHSAWGAVWSHLQLSSLVRGHSTFQNSTNGGFLAPNPWDNSVSQLLEQLRFIFSDWGDRFRPEMALVLERIILSLHVSFEQVQLFAGKAGEEEARRVLPGLRQWVSTKDARKAVWYAGQVLRAAAKCSAKVLQHFNALCVYHAGMTFWTYAVLMDDSSSQQRLQTDGQQTFSSNSAPEDSELVWLDGPDGPGIQKFIALNRGKPVIRHFNQGDHTEAGIGPAIPLTNAKAVMNVCIELLQRGTGVGGDGTSMPLVENLSQLMRDLGTAAHELIQGNGRRSRGQHNSAKGPGPS